MKLKLQTIFFVVVFCASASVYAADVSETWNTKCAICHAKDGSGATPMGKKNGAKDYRDPKVQAAMTDADALKVTREGLPEGKMKTYKDVLTDDEIKGLIAYMRSFKK